MAPSEAAEMNSNILGPPARCSFFVHAINIAIFVAHDYLEKNLAMDRLLTMPFRIFILFIDEDKEKTS